MKKKKKPMKKYSISLQEIGLKTKCEGGGKNVYIIICPLL